MKAQKRNGQIVDFDPGKIEAAVKKAFDSQHKPYDGEIAKGISEQVTAILENKGLEICNVEDIQNLVEKVLMEKDYYDVAKAFILYREKHSESRFIKERIDYMDKYSLSSDNAATSSETDANANVTMKNVATLVSCRLDIRSPQTVN